MIDDMGNPWPTMKKLMATDEEVLAEVPARVPGSSISRGTLYVTDHQWCMVASNGYEHTGFTWKHVRSVHRHRLRWSTIVLVRTRDLRELGPNRPRPTSYRYTLTHSSAAKIAVYVMPKFGFDPSAADWELENRPPEP